MNCREAQSQLFAARDGALEHSERAALASHLDGCAGCRRLQENFASTIESWRTSTQAVRVPDEELEWQKLRREIRGGAGSATAGGRSRVVWFALPLAAAAAVAVGIFVKQDSTPMPEPAPVVARAKADAPTVIFTDEKSGWTFVVATGDLHSG
jgi:anti-sigma factor RsiW